MNKSLHSFSVTHVRVIKTGSFAHESDYTSHSVTVCKLHQQHNRKIDYFNFFVIRFSVDSMNFIELMYIIKIAGYSILD